MTNRYHVLVLKKNVHKPGHFQYTIHYEGKSFSCPRTQKGFTSYYLHFSYFIIFSQIFFVSAILHHISLLTLLPKSYFKISTLNPIFCALAPLKCTLHCVGLRRYRQQPIPYIFDTMSSRYDTYLIRYTCI